MYHLLKWAHPHTRMVFSPDGPDGGGAASTPSGGAGLDGGAGGGSDSVSTSSPAPAGDGGGAAASPSPAPSPEPSPWEGIGGNFDDDVVELPAPTPTPAPAATPAPAPAPAPAAPAPVATPAPEPAAPAPASPAPQEGARQLSADDPGAIAEALHRDRDAVIAHLAQERFALSDADIAELESDVASAIPKLLAKAFVEAQTTTYKFLAQSVPGMIQRHNTVRTANDAAENKFFESNKALGFDKMNPQHRATVTRIATMYRRMHPDIKLDQLISDVGIMAARSLNLQPGTPAAQPTPQRPGGQPFRPALGGGGHSPAPAPENPWEGMGRSYDDED